MSGLRNIELFRELQNIHKQDLTFDLIRVLGERKAFRMIQTFGGQRIQVPRFATGTSKLSETLGESAYKRFVREFSGCFLDLPKGRTMKRILTNRKVNRLASEGKSLNYISKEIGLSRRRVVQIKSEIKKQLTMDGTNEP